MSYGVVRVPRQAVAHYDYYHRPAKQTVEVGAWFASPGWLRDQIDKLRGEYITQGKEMVKQYNDECIAPGFPNSNPSDPERCKKMDRYYEEVWKPLAARFYEFADNHTGSYAKIFFTNFWGSTWDSVKEYRNQLIRLREEAEANGFYFQAPKPLPPPQGPWDTTFTLLKWIVGAIVGFGAIWALTHLVSAFKK